MTYRLVAADGDQPAIDIYDSLFDADEHGGCPAAECVRAYCLIEREPETVEITEWCPFLTCFEPLPHSHAVCRECGAVRYGNAFCSECRSHWPAPRRPA